MILANKRLQPTALRAATDAARCPVSSDRAGSRQSREGIPPLTIHKRRLRCDRVCLVALSGASRAVIGFCRLCSTVLVNASMMGA